MRVLVTGAAGFIGSHLTRRLLAEGDSVGVILRPDSDLWRIDDLLNKLTILRADLHNLSPVRQGLADFAPQHVADLAWQGVKNQDRNGIDQAKNLRNGMELLETLRMVGCQSFIGFGSQAEYGPVNEPISEDKPAYPTTVYGLAKLCRFYHARDFCAANQMRFAWLRLFSSYGPGDDASWLIPSVTLALLKGERPALTRGEQRWDFIHVRDVVEAVVAVIHCSTAQGIFNLGSGSAPSLRETIESLRDVVDPSLPLGFGEIPYRSDQVMMLQADISRLAEHVNWRPCVPLSEGLPEMVAWYRKNCNGGTTCV